MKSPPSSWFPWTLLALLSCASSPAALPARGPSALHYQVRFESGLRFARTRICFDGRPPARLRAIAGAGPDFVGAVRGPSGQPLRRSGATVWLGRLPRGACVRFRARVSGRRRGETLLTSQESWLLRPPEPAEATLELELPAGVQAWLPWAGRGERVALPASALELAGHVVLGSFERRSFDAQGTRVELAVLPGPLAVDPDACERVVSETVGTVAGVYGRFPTDTLHVLVVPVGARVEPEDEPILFGLMRRGGGASAMLLVHADATEGDLRRSWVAYHELSHLLLPMLDRRDGWLAEGVATYYQEVVRVRAGLQTEAQAWTRILDGLGRGAADACPAHGEPSPAKGSPRAKHVHGGLVGGGVPGCSHAPLSGAAEDMRRTGHFYRVYWSGVAFAMVADVALRTGARPSSLDALLLRARPEIRAHRGAVSGSALVHHLDRLSGRQLLSPAYARFTTRRDFPDVSRLLARLGVRVTTDGTLTLSDEAPLAEVRHAIMAARP